VCGGWRPCTLKKLKIKDSKCRGSESIENLLLGVQCGEARVFGVHCGKKNSNSFFNHGQRWN